MKELPGGFYRFGSVNFLFWAMMTSNMYITVYLQDQGFSALEIGSITAIFTIVTIITPPLWGIAADKLRSVRKVFILCISAQALVWCLVPHTARWFSPAVLYITLPLYKFFATPSSSLLDSWVVGYASRERRVNYGPIRLWGSIGYAIVAIFYGELFKTVHLDLVFYGALLFVVPCVLIAQGAKEEGSVNMVSLREIRFGRLFKTVPLMAFLLFMMVLFMPSSVATTFMPYLLQSVGGHNAFIGTMLGWRAVAEIPTLLFSMYMLRRFKTIDIIMVCSCLYALEMFLYGFGANQAHLLLGQCLHGLVYGLFLSCQVAYIHRLAPEGLGATAQTLASCALALSGVAGNLIGGVVVDSISVRALFIGSGVLTLIAAAAYFLWLRIYKPAGA